MIAQTVVVDAACVVDLLVKSPRAVPVIEAIIGRTLAAPAHVDQEVMAALASMEQAATHQRDFDERMALLCALPLRRYPLPPLMRGAWARRTALSVSGGLYVELADQLGALLVTSHPAMAAATDRSILVE